MRKDLLPYILGIVVIALIGFNFYIFSRLSNKKGPTPTPSVTQQTPTNNNTNPAPTIPLKNGAPKEFVPPSNKQTFENKDYKYTVQYPKEFTVDKRGRVGNLEDLTAFNNVDTGKSITVVKIEIRNEAPKDPFRKVQQTGKDADGNEVIVYYFPYQQNKSLVMIGTVYPTIGGNFRYKEIIEEMANSLKID